ncbi:MAG: hypothetical protein AB2693_11050 [Candidatus Thiodiazotropha sp.]
MPHITCRNFWYFRKYAGLRARSMYVDIDIFREIRESDLLTLGLLRL